MKLKSLHHRVMYKLGYEYKYHKWLPVFHPAEKRNYAQKRLLSDPDANELIKNKIKGGEPFLVARLGSVELRAIYNYFLYKGKSVQWDARVQEELQTNAGFYPVTDHHLEQFVNKYFEVLPQTDIMGVWFNEGEEKICKQYCSTAEFIRLAAIEPYYHKAPWSAHLKGKKVLVVHPFEHSIRFQYEQNRKTLFEDKNVLPEFELLTLKAVQSIANNKTPYGTWFEALEHMCLQVSCIDFDIALIGAGAYGLPLGAFVKQLGKQAIHMGGATQILFGIKGKRWESIPEVSRYFNSHWKKPFDSEVPQNARSVEDACYW